jgi:hypothetical protein
VTAPTRRHAAPLPTRSPRHRSLPAGSARAAAELPATGVRERVIQHWQAAEEIRREWLAHGLATGPADRVAAQESLTSIYARLSRPRPRYIWVDSPHAAVPLLDGLPTLADLYGWIHGRQPVGAPPLASDLAASLSRLRSALDECATDPDLDAPSGTRKHKEPWPVLPPLDALRAGVPLREVLRRCVREELRTSLADGFYLPVRVALGPVPVCWYGQQEAYWIGYHDVLRRLGLARYRPADDRHLDEWATLARSCGWWWPGEDRCVIVQRPLAIHAQPPAVEYRDGWRARC